MMAFRQIYERHPALLNVVAAISAFLTYLSMYGFRKPFTATTYDGPLIIGLDPKAAFVLAQLAGYTLSKFIGIRICAELRHEKKRSALFIIGGIATASLLLFATLPPAFRPLALFINGISLGMVWGIVVRYLEGRRSSELLLAALSTSYIFASGFTKSVGRYLLDIGVAKTWMPFFCAALFFIPYIVGILLLESVPTPSKADRNERAPRHAMTSADRRSFLRAFPFALFLLTVFFFLLSAFRDIRDNFQADILLAMGESDAADLLHTELPAALASLLALALLYFVKRHGRALLLTYAMMVCGLILLGGASWLANNGKLSGALWFSLSGVGLYLAYVPFGAVLFERTIAFTRFAGTSVFAMYLVDSAGYSGALLFQLWAGLGNFTISPPNLMQSGLVISLFGIPILIGAGLIFWKKRLPAKANNPTKRS